MLGLLAHAAPISYRFPLPIWLYVLAGGAAVLLSAPAAVLAVGDEPVRERRGPDLNPYVRRLGPVLTAIGTLLVIVGLVWWIQVLLIVSGHVAAVFAAHRLAVRGSKPVRALLAQAPLVALMVAYTVAGLWVLAQQIKVGS